MSRLFVVIDLWTPFHNGLPSLALIGSTQLSIVEGIDIYQHPCPPSRLIFRISQPNIVAGPPSNIVRALTKASSPSISRTLPTSLASRSHRHVVVGKLLMIQGQASPSEDFVCHQSPNVLALSPCSISELPQNYLQLFYHAGFPSFHTSSKLHSLTPRLMNLCPSIHLIFPSPPSHVAPLASPRPWSPGPMMELCQFDTGWSIGLVPKHRLRYRAWKHRHYQAFKWWPPIDRQIITLSKILLGNRACSVMAVGQCLQASASSANAPQLPRPRSTGA